MRLSAYGDLQEAGRSSAAPVHWPLWPAPLPPFVGADGFAAARPARASAAPTVSIAMIFRTCYLPQLGIIRIIPLLTAIVAVWYNVGHMGNTTTKRTEVVKVRVNEEELQWLRDIAALEDRTISSILRIALRDFYNRRMENSHERT